MSPWLENGEREVNVFVAGATGAIGLPLVHQLIEGGHTVSAITRSHDRAGHLRALGIDAYVGDALDRTELSRILATTRPEVMVHQLTTFPTTMRPIRTLREWRQTVRLRVRGTQLFADLAKEFDVRRVVAQSIAFGYRPLPVRREVVEGDPYYGRGNRPIDLFMRHLLRLEEIVMNIEGVEGVALRYGGWYGPGTHFARGGLFYESAMKRRLPIVAENTGTWNCVHVEDAASATVASLEGPTGIFNVVDDDPRPWNGFVASYCRAIGAPAPRTVPRWSMIFAGFYLRHLVLHQMPVDNEKAKRELSWKPAYPSIEQGLAATPP